MADEFEKLYDMHNVELNDKGKKVYTNVKNYFDKEIRGLIREHNLDPLELSYLIQTYANEQCMTIARELKMEREMEEAIDNAEEKVLPDVDPNPNKRFTE